MLLKVSRVQIREQNELQYASDLNDMHPILGKMANNSKTFWKIFKEFLICFREFPIIKFEIL